MYRLRNDIGLNINKTKASETIGISRVYLTNILNGKENCSKVVAFCISKFLDSNKDIEDYFVKEN